MGNNSSRTSAISFEDNPGNIPGSPILDKPNRTVRAKEYEERVNELLNFGVSACLAKESLIPDAAAILAHGPTLASKLGDLADHDEKVRRAVDILTSGSDNPYLACALAAMPLVAQVMRNHETEEAKTRITWRIPFTKREIRLPFRFKLKNPIMRSVTADPQDLTRGVFSNPQIQELLAQRGFTLEFSQNGNGE